MAEHNFRLFSSKLLGYFFVGGVSALIDTSFFALAKYYFHLNYVVALIVGFIPGMLTNFMLCYVTLFYRVGRSIMGAWVRHILSSILSFVFNLLVMSLLIVGLHFEYYLVARLIAIVAGFFLSFVLIRYFAFRDNLQKEFPFVKYFAGLKARKKLN